MNHAIADTPLPPNPEKKIFLHIEDILPDRARYKHGTEAQ
jgi:hypothetical protein